MDNFHRANTIQDTNGKKLILQGHNKKGISILKHVQKTDKPKNITYRIMVACLKVPFITMADLLSLNFNYRFSFIIDYLL